MYHIFCIHITVERYLGCFWVLASISDAAMNIVEHVQEHFSGICLEVVLLGPQVVSTMSNFLRNHQTDFQSGFTSLQSH